MHKQPLVTKFFLPSGRYPYSEGRWSDRGLNSDWSLAADMADMWGSQRAENQKSAWDSPTSLVFVLRLAERVQAHTPQTW